MIAILVGVPTPDTERIKKGGSKAPLWNTVLLLRLRLPEDLFHVLFVVQSAFGDELAVLDEVDGVGAGDLLRVECAEAEEGLAHHVRGQPVPVVVLHLIPEELLLLPDAVDGLHEAAREEVREGPDDLVNLCIEEGEVIVVVLQLLVDPCPRLFCFVAGLVLAVDDLAVFDVRVGDDLRVSDPVALVVLQDRDAPWR